MSAVSMSAGIMFCIRIALRESPPRRMKSSSIPTFSRENVSAKASQIMRSASFLGATYSYLREDRSGFGRALLSTLPFTLRGMESSRMTNVGTMYSGFLSATNR